MKIAILSRSPKAYSTARLKKAAEERGHKAVVLNTLNFALGVDRDHPQLFYKDKAISRYDAVIPRIGASVTFY